MKTFIQSLVKIQGELKAPKNQFNTFGKYKYRNCEDILEALKPLLVEAGLLLTITDEVVNIDTRYYVKSTVTITDGEHSQSVSALAREEQEKKGMDGAQVTGAASSYARKYALNAMFLIDDTKDADSEDNTKTVPQKVVSPKPLPDYIAQINSITSESLYKKVSGEIKNNWSAIPPELKETLQQLLITKKEILGIS